jgi:hypothetical protein
MNQLVDVCGRRASVSQKVEVCAFDRKTWTFEA